MAVRSKEKSAIYAEIVRKRFDRLVDAIKSDVEKVANLAFEKTLITDDNREKAASPSLGGTSANRASTLLSLLLNVIGQHEKHFNTFISILEGVGTVLLKDLATELREAAAQCHSKSRLK